VNQGFVNHPGFSNIVSSFQAPQYYGLPVMPAQQKENMGQGTQYERDAKRK
jgi:hypothetical protein